MTIETQPRRSAESCPPRHRGIVLLSASLLFGLAALPGLATPLATATTDTPAAATVDHEPADGDLAAEPDPAPQAPAAKARSDADGLGAKAADAASATLAALLPRLAANDTLPLLDRSVLLAGDLSRLLGQFQSGTAQAVDAGENKVQSLLKRATALLGTPYRWGGSSPDSGFDCSGLVSYVFRSTLGIELPRASREMARKDDAELIKNRDDLQQGDLVFFGRRGRVDHVGIYVGEGRFLHAPSRGKDVRVDSMIDGYWSGKFMQARRVEM